MKPRKIKAMVFAAGLGTRLMPETKDKPKALVEIGGRPVLYWVLLQIYQAGIKEVCINVHAHAHQIFDWVKKLDMHLDIFISDETNELLETGGALKKAKDFFLDSDFILVYNADILSDMDILSLIEVHQHDHIASLAVMNRNSNRKLLADEKFHLCGWQDESRSERVQFREEKYSYAYSGIMLISKQWFELELEKGKFSIIPSLVRLSEMHLIQLCPVDHTYWFDIGSPEKLDRARAWFTTKHPSSFE
jgi:MurNAc alpha-1-phosphate uridylyltransferase